MTMGFHKPIHSLSTTPTRMGQLGDRLLAVSRVGLIPSFHFINGLLTTFIVTVEDQKRGEWLFMKAFYTLYYLALLILTSPLFILFFPVRVIVLYLRKPYQYSVKHTALNKSLCDQRYKLNEHGDLEFGIVTANVLLGPEYTIRYNNMKHGHLKGREIGERIVIDQFFPRSHHSNSSTPVHGKEGWLSNGFVHKNHGEVEGKVRSHFSSLDFICLQETFCNYHNVDLNRELHKVYPYIVHDIGFNSFTVNKFIHNSGLLFASRYPVEAVDFKPFSDFVFPGTILSQGMVMTKVVIKPENSSAKEGQKVGYVFNVHLQAYQGDCPIIPKQFEEILKWIDEFVLNTKKPGEHILFNILCGDFNSDNLSPCDRDNASHEIFKIYKDFGRVVPGKEKDWTVGTELRQNNMLDPIVSTPEGLKRVIEDPCLRRTHLNDANIRNPSLQSLVLDAPPTDANGKVLPSSVGGRRRVDLINYHSKYPVKVESYDFVTRLAALTDHIPIQMTFSCSPSATA